MHTVHTVHTVLSFFLQGKKVLKEKLEHLDFFTVYTIGPIIHTKTYYCKYDKFQKIFTQPVLYELYQRCFLSSATARELLQKWLMNKTID